MGVNTLPENIFKNTIIFKLAMTFFLATRSYWESQEVSTFERVGIVGMGIANEGSHIFKPGQLSLGPWHSLGVIEITIHHFLQPM